MAKEPFTRRTSENASVSERPWTPENYLLLCDAFEQFGKAFLANNWTGKERLARPDDFGPPQPPKRPYSATVGGENAKGRQQTVHYGSQQTVYYVVEGRKIRLSYEEAVEKFESEREELERLWKEEKSAYQRYKDAVREFRRVLHAKHVSACILTHDGGTYPLPIETWAENNVCKTFRSGKARHAITRRNVIEGIVLIPKQELMSYLETHYATNVSDEVVGRHPPETTSVDVIGMPASKAGGRPAKWDWEGCWLQICVSIHNEGLPKTQAELVRKLQDWFLESTGEEPSDSSIRLRTVKVFNALRPSKNS